MKTNQPVSNEIVIVQDDVRIGPTHNKMLAQIKKYSEAFTKVLGICIEKYDNDDKIPEDAFNKYLNKMQEFYFNNTIVLTFLGKISYALSSGQNSGPYKTLDEVVVGMKNTINHQEHWYLAHFNKLVDDKTIQSEFKSKTTSLFSEFKADLATYAWNLHSYGAIRTGGSILYSDLAKRANEQH